MSRLFACILALTVLSMVLPPWTDASAKGRQTVVADSKQKKADYLFMEAASAYNRGDYEQSYKIGRAHV